MKLLQLLQNTLSRYALGKRRSRRRKAAQSSAHADLLCEPVLESRLLLSGTNDGGDNADAQSDSQSEATKDTVVTDALIIEYLLAFDDSSSILFTAAGHGSGTAILTPINNINRLVEDSDLLTFVTVSNSATAVPTGSFTALNYVVTATLDTGTASLIEVSDLNPLPEPHDSFLTFVVPFDSVPEAGPQNSVAAASNESVESSRSLSDPGNETQRASFGTQLGSRTTVVSTEPTTHRTIAPPAEPLAFVNRHSENADHQLRPTESHVIRRLAQTTRDAGESDEFEFEDNDRHSETDPLTDVALPGSGEASVAIGDFGLTDFYSDNTAFLADLLEYELDPIAEQETEEEDEDQGTPDAYAEQANQPSRDSDRHRPKATISRLDYGSTTTESPVILSDQPLEPPEIIGIWQRLKFDSNPRGPPRSDRIASSEFARLTSHAQQLQQLRYSIAPRGPSLASAL